MAEIQPIAVEPRERAGKGSARADRRAGRVPAIIYGDKRTPDMITLSRNDLVKLINKGTFLTSLFEVDVAGKKQSVLPRDLQLHPVSDEPLHVDFLRLGKGATVVIEVPVQFIDEEECPGLKRGGILNIVRHTIECTCLAEAIPDRLVISLAGLEINDSVHISAVEMPEGVAPTITDRDFTVATVTGMIEEEEIIEEDEEDFEGEEGAEGVEGEEGADGAGGEEGAGDGAAKEEGGD